MRTSASSKSSRSSDRLRQVRVSTPWLGRTMPSQSRRVVLDDALLGSAWRWDADEDRSAAAR